MAGELVLRSLRLTKAEDLELRKMAWEAKVSIGDLVRAAVASRIDEWEKDKTDGVLKADLAAISYATADR